jgi:hypothetical protein
MKRFRWIRAEWPLSMRTLGSRLKAKAFGPEMSHGFVIDRIRDEFLDGRYIERIEYTETVVDPFGLEQSFERIEYRQSAFRATTSGSGLELRDPPRSIQSLMNRLSEAADFELAITAQTVDVMAWAEQFQNILQASVVVDSLQMSSFELDQGITAKVIVKGDRDVRAACALLAGDRKYSLEKIQLRLLTPIAGAIVLANTASASFNIDDRSDELLEALRAAMPIEKRQRLDSKAGTFHATPR